MTSNKYRRRYASCRVLVMGPRVRRWQSPSARAYLTELQTIASSVAGDAEKLFARGKTSFALVQNFFTVLECLEPAD